MTKKRINATSKALRTDNWSNILTGLLMDGRDKRTGVNIRARFLPKTKLEAMYQTDDISARVVDKLPNDMFREGYKVSTGDPEVDKMTHSWLEEMDVNSKLQWNYILARLYGSSCVYMGINADDPGKPLDLNKIDSIDFFVVLERWQLNIDRVDGNINSKNYGKPERYLLQPTFSTTNAKTAYIHHTRMIRFDGVELPPNLLTQNSYWGGSVLDRLYQAVADFQTAFGSSAIIMQEFSHAVMKMKDLTDLIASGKEDLVKKRLQLVRTLTSVLNAVVVEEGEEYEFRSVQVAGLKDLLEKFEDRVVSASGMPHTVLLGDSAGGLGATGESEWRTWYADVKAKQVALLKPALERLLKVYYSTKSGPTKGVVPEFKIEFCPLYQPTQKEIQDARKTQSDIDGAYLDRGVLTPEEVSASRFGTGQYSFETVLDDDARKDPVEEAPDPEENQE